MRAHVYYVDAEGQRTYEVTAPVIDEVTKVIESEDGDVFSIPLMPTEVHGYEDVTNLVVPSDYFERGPLNSFGLRLGSPYFEEHLRWLDRVGFANPGSPEWSKLLQRLQHRGQAEASVDVLTDGRVIGRLDQLKAARELSLPSVPIRRFHLDDSVDHGFPTSCRPVGRDRNLKGSAKLAYFQIQLVVGPFDRTRLGLQAIAEISNASVRNFRRRIRALEQAGLLSVHQRGRRLPALIELNDWTDVYGPECWPDPAWPDPESYRRRRRLIERGTAMLAEGL